MHLLSSWSTGSCGPSRPKIVPLFQRNVCSWPYDHRPKIRNYFSSDNSKLTIFNIGWMIWNAVKCIYQLILVNPSTFIKFFNFNSFTIFTSIFINLSTIHPLSKSNNQIRWMSPSQHSARKTNKQFKTPKLIFSNIIFSNYQFLSLHHIIDVNITVRLLSNM